MNDMNEPTVTREEILRALVEVYQDGYAEYVSLDNLATEMYGAGDKEASEVVRRYVYNRCSFLDGVKRSAEALGIDETEFHAAVTSSRETN